MLKTAHFQRTPNKYKTPNAMLCSQQLDEIHRGLMEAEKHLNQQGSDLKFVEESVNKSQNDLTELLYVMKTNQADSVTQTRATNLLHIAQNIAQRIKRKSLLQHCEFDRGFNNNSPYSEELMGKSQTESEMNKLCSQISDLGDIYRDLNTEVQSQYSMVNSVEIQIDKTSCNVHLGEEGLSSARQLVNKTHNWRKILIAIVVGMVLLTLYLNWWKIIFAAFVVFVCLVAYLVSVLNSKIPILSIFRITGSSSFNV